MVMATFWDADRRADLLQRMDRVSPPRVPKWGSMNAEQMVEHVTAHLEMALGDLPVRIRPSWLAYWPIRDVIIRWLPWPKGAPTVRELLQSTTANWEQVRLHFKRTFERVIERGPHGRFAPHPVFGRMSQRLWGVLIYRHLDHHLRQFGE